MLKRLIEKWRQKRRVDVAAIFNWPSPIETALDREEFILTHAREILQSRWNGAKGNEVMVKVAGFTVIVDSCQASIDSGLLKLMLIDGEPEIRSISPHSDGENMIESRWELVERICSAVKMASSDNESWEVRLGNHVVHEHLGEVSDAKAAVLNMQRQIREAAK